AQFVPDREGVLGPARIGVVEIIDPVVDRRMFRQIARSVGHQCVSLAVFVRGRLDRGGGDHSSVTSIAISGQLVWASQALSSRPAGTVPSPTSCALPYSSSSNSSGASDLQRAWPWHLSWSTWIFSFAMASVSPLALGLSHAARVP